LATAGSCGGTNERRNQSGARARHFLTVKARGFYKPRRKNMKMKLRTLIIIAALGVFSLSAQSPAPAPIPYQAPALSAPGNFTVVMIPDIQSYVKFERNQGIWDLMAAWIAENIQPLNIMTAVQVGDIVEANEMYQPDGKRYNQTSEQMWLCASNGFARLDGKLPYIMCTGNHDYGLLAAEDRRTRFPDFFPETRNPAWQGVLVEYCENRDGRKTLENAAYRFKTPNGPHLLFVALEFAPSDPVVAWAKALFARPEYAADIGIVSTHSYMRNMLKQNQRVDKERYKVADVNYGQALWEKLIEPAANIRLVLCGHIAMPDNFKGGVGFRVDQNAAGKSVIQILFNTQALGGGWMGNGGDGWLRLMEFTPDGRQVTVKTFSPLYAISPTTQFLAWEPAGYNNFTFTIE
jgi:hypothetical protein